MLTQASISNEPFHANTHILYGYLIQSRQLAIHNDVDTEIIVNKDSLHHSLSGSSPSITLNVDMPLPHKGTTMTCNRQKLGFNSQGNSRYAGSIYLTESAKNTNKQRKLTIGVGNGEIRIY